MLLFHGIEIISDRISPVAAFRTQLLSETCKSCPNARPAGRRWSSKSPDTSETDTFRKARFARFTQPCSTAYFRCASASCLVLRAVDLEGTL